MGYCIIGYWQSGSGFEASAGEAELQRQGGRAEARPSESGVFAIDNAKIVYDPRVPKPE
jgi:hypothetical protein